MTLELGAKVVYACGCTLGLEETDDTLSPAFEMCRMHKAAPAMLRSLEALQSVRPRPVKIPGTDMHLTLSYTRADLGKIKVAQATIHKVRQ